MSDWQTMKVVAVLSSIFLSSCTSPDERCQKWGAVPGTPEYVQCRATLHTGGMNAFWGGVASSNHSQSQSTWVYPGCVGPGCR